MINLNLGDCIEAMSKMPDNAYSLAIVDPPYGGSDAINPKSSTSKYSAKRKEYKEFCNNRPDLEYFEELKRVSRSQIIWGVNFFTHVGDLLKGGRICWDKKGTAFGRAELAYNSQSNAVNVVELIWNGMLQEDMKNKEHRIHPTQKPVKLYEWLLMNYAKEGDKILDTHLGSGSIAIACHNLGFSLDAWEIDKDYHKAAVKRFNNHTAQLRIY